MTTIKDLVYEGDYNVSKEDLDFLSDCHTKINGYFSCSNNNLKSLEHCPNFMFDFEDIKEEFEKYGNYLLKKEQNRLKQKTKENIQINKIKINKNDYGLSI